MFSFSIKKKYGLEPQVWRREILVTTDGVVNKPILQGMEKWSISELKCKEHGKHLCFVPKLQ